jgi:dTDP-4-dehydrorhamnose 3,5-epimerase
MRFETCPIRGAWLIEATPHEDERGRFFRAWCANELGAQGIDFRPVQANVSSSRETGTIRGLHYQTRPALEAKLIRCTRGAVFDVIVDMRPGSPTQGQWFGTRLSAAQGNMLYVPEECAHGYQTLEDDSETYYLTSAFYAPDAVRGVRFDDPAIGITWPLAVSAVSDQDRRWPLVTSVRDRS